MSKNLLFLSDITELNKDVVGGKAWNLAQLTQLGMNVPSGFVIPTTVFSSCITGFDDLLKRLEVEFHNDLLSELKTKIENTELTHISQELQKATEQLASDLFAVRSSANVEDSAEHSFAGQFKTLLSVSPTHVEQAIKECWAAAFTEQSIHYCKQNKIPLFTLQLAIIVQVQLKSEYSGIGFTTHPITNDHNQMVIEGGWGLGELLVAGQITPTTWIIDKDQETVIEVLAGDQKNQLVIEYNKVVDQVVPDDKQQAHGLHEELLNELIKHMKKIEQHFGKPQDVEWTVENNTLHILQARPITTV